MVSIAVDCLRQHKTPTFLHENYRELTPKQKVIANGEMDGTNFDCNKCGTIILRTEAECLMGGKKGEIPDICYEFGSVCQKCFKNGIIQ